MIWLSLKFVAVLLARLATESAGRHSENLYHAHRHIQSAAWVTVCYFITVPIARLVVGESDNVAFVAGGVALFVTTLHFSRRFERQRSK